jgi:hypothetical protein
MNAQEEHRDAKLARAIARIAVPSLDRDFLASLVSATPPDTVAINRRRHRRSTRAWLLAAAAVASLAAVAAVAIVRGNGTTGTPAIHTHLSAAVTDGSECCKPGETPQQWFKAYLRSHPQTAKVIRRNQKLRQRAASRAMPGSTGVRTLLAYTRIVRPTSTTDLPASVSELIKNEETFLTVGEAPTSIQEPIIGSPAAETPSIYLVTYPDNLCMIIALKGAAGTCYVALRQAGGSISIDDSIVGGKRFIHGLVANDIKGLTVTLAATATGPAQTVPATIQNNAFIAPLSYGGGYDLSAATITITHADGTITTITMPRVPTPRSPHRPARSPTPHS